MGYEPEEIVGKTLFDLMPREEAKRVGEEVEPMTVARRRIAGLENVNVHKNGRHVVLETSGVPIFDAEGNYRGYRGIDRDITARKLVDEALTRSEQEYRGVVERALQGIYKTTEEGKILMANPAMVRMLGFDSEDELLALDSVADLYVRSEDRREVLRKMGQADDTTVELKHKDGRKLTVRVSGTFVANTPEGTPVFPGDDPGYHGSGGPGGTASTVTEARGAGAARRGSRPRLQQHIERHHRRGPTRHEAP